MGNKNVTDTSREAKKSLSPDWISQTENKILETLSRIGQGHYEDMAIAAGLKPDTVWKRCADLHKKGKIIRTGERKMLSSKRMGFVWTLKTEDNVDQVEVKKKLKKTPTVQDFSRAIKQPAPSSKIQERLF